MELGLFLIAGAVLWMLIIGNDSMKHKKKLEDLSSKLAEQEEELKRLKDEVEKLVPEETPDISYHDIVERLEEEEKPKEEEKEESDEAWFKDTLFVLAIVVGILVCMMGLMYYSENFS